MYLHSLLWKNMQIHTRHRLNIRSDLEIQITHIITCLCIFIFICMQTHAKYSSCFQWEYLFAVDLQTVCSLSLNRWEQCEDVCIQVVIYVFSRILEVSLTSDEVASHTSSANLVHPSAWVSSSVSSAPCSFYTGGSVHLSVVCLCWCTACFLRPAVSLCYKLRLFPS